MAAVDQEVNPIKAKAGKKGGQATVKRYGNEHMRKIGRAGAKMFWKRYTLRPVELADFAIVNRETGKAVALMYDYRRVFKK